MATARTEPPAHEAPLGELEQALIDEYVRRQGYDPGNLGTLSNEERHRLLTEASTYASVRLMEVESRARFVHELHDGGSHS